MDILKTFYENNVLRDAVKEAMIETLERKIIDKAFQGQDIKGYAEAKNVIESFFANLEGTYEKPKSKKTDSR